MYQAKARVIQKWFRYQRKSWHQEDASSGVRSYHTTFREALGIKNVGTGFYHKLMLGPLPHLMLALHYAETKVSPDSKVKCSTIMLTYADLYPQITIVRRELKKQLLTANQELEALDDQLTSTRYVVRGIYGETQLIEARFVI